MYPTFLTSDAGTVWLANSKTEVGFDRKIPPDPENRDEFRSRLTDQDGFRSARVRCFKKKKFGLFETVGVQDGLKVDLLTWVISKGLLTC